MAVPPGHGQLRMWGRHGEHWYALIAWQAQCHDYRVGGGASRGVAFCTAWVDAEHVAKVAGQDYQDVPRVRLHLDPQCWPTRLRPGTTSASSDYYLGLLDGTPIIAPPGLTWMTGMNSLYG